MERGTAWLLVALVTAAGCRGPGDAAPRVRGRVFCQGVPLEGGVIVFTPDAERGGSGPSAIAAVRPDGSYQFPGEGANAISPGWHRVTVAAVPADASSATPKPAKRYLQPDLSGLECEVQTGRENVFDFQLDSG